MRGEEYLWGLAKYFIFSIALLSFQSVLASDDPLPSWNEGTAKKEILSFVHDTTDQGNPNFIPKSERIASFDQDGTLWVEQPLYTQLFFIIERAQALVKSHPEWKTEAPYQAIVSEAEEPLSKMTEQGIEQVAGVVLAGMSVDEFHEQVRTWLKKAIHPRFKRPFTELVYQPMLEVIELFRNNGYKVYIVSGGGQEFMRAYTDSLYGIPPEQIIGTAGKVKYEYKEGRPELIKLSELLLIDNYGGKPEGINLIIGRRPVAAFGNSDGDRQMLEWTHSEKGKRLQLLVHHDDAVREYAYGAESKIGTFSDSLMQEAKEKGWIVVSIKDDWKVVFPNRQSSQ